MEHLPFTSSVLPNEFICRNYVASSYYSDEHSNIEVDFNINLKIYKKYISIILIEYVEKTIDIGYGNIKLKRWNNKRKTKINIITFDDIINFNNTMIDISNYIYHYQYKKYENSGPVYITRSDWWLIDNLSKKKCIDNSNNIKKFMNNFHDFFILFNINFKKIPKWIIINISSFIIEDDIIKLFEFY